MTLSAVDRNQLINNYCQKPIDIKDEIEILISNNQLFTAVNRICYGIFYMLSALALKNNFSTSKHTKLIGWFNREFVKTNKIDKQFSRYIQEAYEKRMKGDYEIMISFSIDDVTDLFEKMKKILLAIKSLL